MGAHAGNVDDAALVGTLFQIGVADNAHLEQVLDIHVHDVVKLLHGEVLGAALEADTGVVDQKIKAAAVLCGKVCDHDLHGLYVAHIAFQVYDTGGAFTHALFGLSGTADDIDRCAGLGQHIRDLEPDTAAAASDDTGLSLQICHTDCP